MFHLFNERKYFLYSLSFLYNDFRICKVSPAEEEAGRSLVSKVLNLCKTLKHFQMSRHSKYIVITFIKVVSETLELTVRKLCVA